MKKFFLILVGVIAGGLAIASPFLYAFVGPKFDQNQLDTLLILSIITACSVLFCFVVGEITRNNSQMDKLWSILPAVYTWIIAIKGHMKARLVVMAVLATIWAIRLTINFARKGAYSIKFWEGVEDYRWVYLRSKKPFDNKFVWMIFNFFFISIYQNVLVLLTTFPALASMSSEKSFNWIDICSIALLVGFLTLETIADEQQWRFQTKKHQMLKEGKKLEELEAPYNKGFNTTGLWNRARHPNYLGEQGTWASFYCFSIAAGIGVLNYSVMGAALLIALFLGSSTLAEKISSSKYPLYQDYINNVSRYIPWRSYTK